MNSGDSTVSILYPPLNFNYLVKLNFVDEVQNFHHVAGEDFRSKVPPVFLCNRKVS